MPRTKLTKKEYNSFKKKWIQDAVCFMDRKELEHFTTLYFQEDLETAWTITAREQEDAFEVMQSINDEVFSILADEFNLEVKD